MERGYRSVAVGDLAGDVGPLDPAQPVLLELDAMHPGGRVEGTRAFFARWRAFTGAAGALGRRAGPDPPRPGRRPAGADLLTSRLYQAVLTRQQLHDLIADDRREPPPTIFKAWPDYTMTAHIDRSAATVKSDAARRTFAAAGRGIVWAVLDSGIDAAHPHFSGLGIAADAARAAGTQPAAGAAPPAAAAPTRTAGLHRDFTGLVRVPPTPTRPSPPARRRTRGRPVGPVPRRGRPRHPRRRHHRRPCPPAPPPGSRTQRGAARRRYVVRAPTNVLAGHGAGVRARQPQGAAPEAAHAVTSSAAVMRALEYIRREVNVAPNAAHPRRQPQPRRAWDPSHYAAGASPLCQAIDQLARRA